MTYSPNSTSTKTILHYLRVFRSGNFTSRDKSVKYDLRKTDVPVEVYWTEGDWAAGKDDINDIVQALPKVTVSSGEHFL